LEKSKNIPELFIVGAPKCGTSSMDHYLSLHPEVFMAPKELHQFGADLNIIQEKESIDSYLDHFSEAQEPLLGESSVWYLYSSKAATEIHNIAPESKILVMLRNPADFAYSLHAQFIYDGDELEVDPNKAIFNSDYGNSTNFESRPDYLEAAKFGAQAKRYLELFGRDQVKFVFLEDLISEPKRVYDECLSFLNLSPYAIEFKRINERKTVKSAKLQKLLRQKPEALKDFVKTLIPSKAIRHQLMLNLERFNKGGKQAELSAASRKRIFDILKDDLMSLSELTNRDLSHWS